MQPNISHSIKFPALIISLVLFVALTETVLRVADVDTYFQNRFFVLNRALDYPEVFLRDRTLFWRFRPEQTVTSTFFQGQSYTINSLGMLGREIDKDKVKPRIIALGNSCTFGWGIKSENVYPARLEELLEYRYEVINAGIPGYTSYQGSNFLERDLLKLKPDIILILFGWNDHWAAANGIPDKKQQFPPEPIISLQNNLSRLHLYRLLKKWLLSAVEQDPDSLFSRRAPVYRVDTTDFELNLARICKLAGDNNCIPILLTAPIPSLENYYPPGIHSPLHEFHEKYNRVIRNLAAKEHIMLIDIAREFDKYDDLYDDAPKDPIHFNDKGHDIAARLIAEEIIAVPK